MSRSPAASSRASAPTTFARYAMEHSWSISERISELLAERDAANALILPTFFVPRLEICGADLTKVTILEGVKQADGRRTFSLQQDLPLGQQRHRRRRPSRVSRPPQHAPGLPVWRDRLATGSSPVAVSSAPRQ